MDPSFPSKHGEAERQHLMAKAKNQRAVIVGVGASDYAQLYRTVDPDMTMEGLGLDVLRAALQDAGLTISAIDGLITSGSFYYPNFAFRAGLRDARFIIPYPMSGRMCAPALNQACMAVENGHADYVALVYSTTMRSTKMSFGSEETAGDMYDAPYGMTSPGAYYAMAYDRYQKEYGLQGKDELLAAVPVAIRHHASLNPSAVMQAPIAVDDYMQSRFVARPLRLFDYCLVTDGAVCYIVTTEERARDLKKPPVFVAAVAEKAALREWFVPEDLWYSACQDMGKRVLQRAGLTLSDISSLQVYDNFSISVIWALEGYGFCPRGTALDWVQGGKIALGGSLPINTSGGMLSEAYLQGWNHHVEAVRQLRGECGARQVTDCSAVLYSCLGPVASATLLTRG